MTFSSDNSLNTNQLPISLDVDPKDNNYQDVLQLYLRRVANAVNTKESGLFLLQENANFEQWFTYDGSGNPNPQQNRSSYRITCDFVKLNAGNIPNGATTLTLTTLTQPKIISGYLYPVQGFGGAIDVDGLSYFINDPQIYVRYQSSTNTFNIQNNTGKALTWFVWVTEYLKN